MTNKSLYKAIVIGASAGGMNAFLKLLPDLPGNFPIPIIIAQHLHPSDDSALAKILNNRSLLTVKEAVDKEPVQAGFVYIAPPNYHLQVEKDKTFSLSNDEKVNYSRPSIDVLFESAAYVWTSGLIAIILTGASNDGSAGIKLIRSLGGLTIAQDPSTAEHPYMPQSAIYTGTVSKILTIQQIKEILIELSGSK